MCMLLWGRTGSRKVERFWRLIRGRMHERCILGDLGGCLLLLGRLAFRGRILWLLWMPFVLFEGDVS